MEKFWVIIDTAGESWQTYGTLAEALELYTREHDEKDIIAILSHRG